jgi:hypothetical protein
MHHPNCSDRSSGKPVTPCGDTCGTSRRQDRESGQAIVEFVLVLIPLVIFVGGIIQLGIGVSDWHHVNRIANEGARYAAINDWPTCVEAPAVCKGDVTCDDSLNNYLRCQARNAGLPPSTIRLCQPAAAASGAPEVGEPVTVRLTTRVTFLGGSRADRKKLDWLGITIRGQATMRLETRPTSLGALGACP